MAAEPFVEPALCRHCGLEVPPGPKLFATINGQRSLMCCVGCRAVAEMLEESGLGEWYARRESPTGQAAALPEEVLGKVAHLETQALEDEFVYSNQDGYSEVHLLVDDLRCAACVWVIERHLGELEGVKSVRVLLASHRVFVSWQEDHLRLRDVIERLAEIGFAAVPDCPGAESDRDRREKRAALIRLGVAGLGAMNVMTYAVALYAGGFEGMSRGAEALMRWMGWLVSTPIVVISARPFFVGAWRDLKRRRPGMDVPVALAIGGAYVVSAFATVRGIGEVYFDSVCMFTFFLTLGRYLEQRSQAEGASYIREIAAALPALARRLVREGKGGDFAEIVVAARSLFVGDRVRVLPGEVVPADGIVVLGMSSVDEALLSGEPWPRAVTTGDAVVAGSQNVDQPIEVEATRVGTATRLARILSLVEGAASDRAPIAQLADRVAAYFVSTVLGVALINWIVWTAIAPERAVWTTLSVLVATCPCALSLATPMAISSASQGLARAGFLIRNARAIEDFSQIDRVIFDKTGTLTEGAPRITEVVRCSEASTDDVFSLAAALESESAHPIATAFKSDRWNHQGSRDELGLASGGDSGPGMSFPIVVKDRRIAAGEGVEGWVGGRKYRIGRGDWASEGALPAFPNTVSVEAETVWVLLSEGARPLAWFGLVDPLRENVREAIVGLKSEGIQVELLSGDPSDWVPRLASELGLSLNRHGANPEQKLDRIRELQEAGEQVALVGDGVNDSPSLRAADVSIAMGSGCDLSRLNADAVLLSDDLSVLPEAQRWASRVRLVIAQNLSWAVIYNLLALPLAVTGNLPPWVAALGMSASSLVVVLNATRLTKRIA